MAAAPIVRPMVADPAPADPGRRMLALAAELFPIHRSVTGPGVRSTLARLAEEVPLEIREVPSGTRVFDWTVPPEWRLRDAYVADESGRRLIDARVSNLHVVGHSVPVRARMTWRDLRPRVHTLPERPRWIPYRIDWTNEDWGFCMTHETYEWLDTRPDREYEVVIDADLAPGSLTWGEARLPGSGDREILVWTHVCHPSLANDGLSGVVLAAEWARRTLDRERRHTWRFVFAPATIGALAWLHENRQRIDRIDHGLVLACLGGDGPFTWKRSRRGDAAVDRAAARVLADSGWPHEIRPFSPLGYDERQFGSPGFDLPVGRLTRTPNGEYPEYHSSADDLTLLSAAGLAQSLALLEEIGNALERNRRCRNTRPMGEPRLSRWGLHEAFGRAPDRSATQAAAMWTLNLSDGRHDLLDVAAASGLPVSSVMDAADALRAAGLLDELEGPIPERQEER